MVFVQLLYGAVLAFVVAAIATESWVWCGWLVLLVAYFIIQRQAPHAMEPHSAREVFGFAVMMQFVLVMVAACISGYVGAWLIAFGVSANCAVIVANGNRMPAIYGWEGNACYMEHDDTVRLVWLSDIFPTRTNPGRRIAVSAGDALEVIGLWVLAAELVLV